MSHSQSPSGGSGENARPGARPLALLLALGLASLLVLAGLVAPRADDPAVAPAQTSGLRGSQLPPELEGSAAPAFSLRDARGAPVDSRSLRGRPYLLTFLFTDCVDVCLAIGQQTRIALEQLGDGADGVAAVGVSVDPKGDTPNAVQAWLRRQRLPPNFHYAIGSKRDLEPLWKAYFAAPKIDDRPETSTHAAAIWLIDARGRLRTRYSAGSPVDPADLAHDLRMLLDET